MSFIAELIALLNAGMNKLFRPLRWPMTALPLWLSLTIISSVLGVVLLVLFKYTSNQTAIGRTRDTIKAHLLAMKLFKDNIPVVLKSQIKIFSAAIRLLFYSIPPLLVMALPFCLIMGQLALWFQAAPLNTGQQAVVMMQLKENADDPLPPVSLTSTAGVKVVTGPVRVPSKRQVFWEIQADQSGQHQLEFVVDNMLVQKELAVGGKPMPISLKRPGMSFVDLIFFPAEKPFDKMSPVQSIRIDYPERPSSFAGSDVWVIWLFLISMLSAILFKPLLKVKI